jgi:hypothetical protein
MATLVLARPDGHDTSPANAPPGDCQALIDAAHGAGLNAAAPSAHA